MQMNLKDLYEFWPFQIDVNSRLFLHNGQPVSITPKVFDALLLLAESRGRLVTKDEVMKALWPETFVDEANVTQTIFMLRKALGESASEQRYIITVPGRGYRFAADVRQVARGNEPEVPPSAKQRSSQQRLFLTIAIVLLLMAGIGAYSWWRKGRPRSKANSRIVLAVLPFENFTGDPTQEFLSDGVTEEMITQLGRMDPQRVGVIARTSVMHYKNGRTSLAQIARELGVQYVLEGSVQRDKDKVRITVQLVQTKDQTHVWARQYDRELTDLLSVEDEIAQETADEIQLIVGTKPHQHVYQALATHAPQSYQAYESYLKGRYFWNKRTEQSLTKAIVSFQEAIKEDPLYARAYAALAASYALLNGYSSVPQKSAMSKARAAALRALQLDDQLPEAHAALGYIAENYDWDWDTAEKEFRRAIELNPNYATGHHWYAECLALQGRFDEAFRQIEIARQLDPLSLIIATDDGAFLYFSGQYDKAAAQFNSVLQMESNFPRAYILVNVLMLKGDFTDALKVIKEWQRLELSPWSLADEAYVYARSGKQREAERTLAKLQEWNRREPLDPTVFAIVYLGLNRKNEAIKALQNAVEQHASPLTAMKVEPLFDPLRVDPRFQQMLRQLNLSQ